MSECMLSIAPQEVEIRTNDCSERLCQISSSGCDVMSDKRQRARVQGSWAKQLPQHTRPAGTVSNNHQHQHQPQNANPAPSSWGFGPQNTSETFEFHQPTKPIRDVPPEKVIDYYCNAGEAYDEPRLTCWYGELAYTYARSTMAANTQWHPLLLPLREAVEQASSCRFNSLLCNMYRDGHDSIGWHSDDEASLGAKPTIASLSLGDTRVFNLRKQPPPEENGDYTYVEQIRVPLSHGTLLLMEGATQDDWQHQVAKEYHDRGPRINLTFRTVYPEPEGHRPGTKLRFAAKQQPHVNRHIVNVIMRTNEGAQNVTDTMAEIEDFGAKPEKVVPFIPDLTHISEDLHGFSSLQHETLPRKAFVYQSVPIVLIGADTILTQVLPKLCMDVKCDSNLSPDL
ncbi:hypothetical protein F2P81_006423 [Scophthalmus maximus]|uniref:Fe2OG dioxygenase domain-containing protein n=1 Tax=Scophthalmus maximus TaxID=52904 RepID=A0A6A4T5X1_SCOMX|nr:hypothetical protein F2P81_006423 [Scophthalmus maximus]